MSSPDHATVDAALAAYEQAVLTSASAQQQLSATTLAQLQAQLSAVQSDDSDKTTKLAAAQQQISQLQALLTPSNAATSVSPPALAPISSPTVTQFKDFSTQYSGWFTSGKSISGAGVSKLTYEMIPGSSTKAAYANGIPAGQPNLLTLIRTGGLNSANIVSALDVSGFTLQGTEQGSLYNGLQIGYSTNAHVHDLTVKAIPGATSSPPGETFSLSLWHALAAVVENVLLDGRDVSGNPAAATILGLNSSSGCTLRNLMANYALNGFGLAIWDSYNITATNVDLSKNRAPLNIEQPHAGTMTFDKCNFSGQTLMSHPTITCNGNIASTVLNIIDPVLDDSQWPLKVGVSSNPYMGQPQLQKVSDVHLIINGIDVSNDRTKLNCGNVW